jgi:uncharacterized protein YbjQ (UPF0145 family)
MFCVALLGYYPGNLLVGNSVFSIGYLGSVGSRLKTMVGGEVKGFTNMIAEGRRLSLQRFNGELAKQHGAGSSSVSSEMIFHPGNVEFLTIGSTIYRRDGAAANAFTTSSDGQELFCQWDAGYAPRSFVFGNVAYSIGVGKGLLGSFRKLAKGEVKEYSEVFNVTRNLALERLQADAKKAGANSVVGVRTTILPLGQNGNIQEMAMIGTASYHQQLTQISQAVGGVTTSDMTAEETWNVAKLGYVPMKLVLGTSVYSLGFVGGIMSSLKNLVKGEISELTQMIYGAREQSLQNVHRQAEAIGADDVLGIKTYIYNIGGGLIEFMAMGTAVKRVNSATPRSEQLPPQAIIRDKDTFLDFANFSYGTNLQHPSR